MNQVKVITLLILCCMFSETSIAKDVKIKYTSTMEYIGEGKKKTPMGMGKFSIYSKENKKEAILTLSGIFECREGQNSEFTIKDSELSFLSGLSLKSPFLSISISKEKDNELVKCQLPECQIIDNTYKIECPNVEFSVQWNKAKGREYSISITTSGVGTMFSNFIVSPDVQALCKLGKLDLTPVKEIVYFDLINNSYPPYYPNEIKLKDKNELTLDSGLNIVTKENEIIYSFPNNNTVSYLIKGDNDISCSKAEMSFPEGHLSYDGRKVVVTYTNGNQLEGRNLKDIEISPEYLLQMQSLNDIRLKNGVYTNKKDGYADTYNNGSIVERILSDGSISLGKSGLWNITYNEGPIFTGSDNNFIKNYDKVQDFSSVHDALINNGKLSKNSDEWDIYENGVIIGGRWLLADGGYIEYERNIPIKLTYPNGSYTSNAQFEKQLSYSPKLKSSDFIIKEGKVNFLNGRSLSFSNGRAMPRNYEDIQFIANSKGLSSTKIILHHEKCNLSFVEGDDDNNIIKINSRDNVKQLNTTDFYINVTPDYRFSWPKSFIIKGYTNIGDHPVVEAYSNKLNDVYYFTDEPDWPGDVRHYLVWVYKPVAEKDGITYGQTKSVYVMGKDDSVEYDLSETFIKGNNRSFKEVRPAPKKKKYHAKGRIEDCGICLGTGMGWQGGICPFCGGRGWYVEHEW